MFQTLELQNLNKLGKGEVRHFSTPQAFHAVKVERLGSDKVKPSAKVGRQFEMPIAPLVSNFAVKPCEFTDGPPPIARPFDFSADGFVERSELVQGAFKELWRLYFLTGVEREISVFHTEVCTYTFTRSRQDFFTGIIGYDIQPIRTNTIAKDLEITDVSMPRAVLVKKKPTLVELETGQRCVPLFQGDADTSFFYFVACLKLRRAVASFAFAFRLACALDIEKALPSDVQADNDSVKCVAGDPSPVFLGPLQQLRQVRLQAKTSSIFTINAVIAIFQLQKVVMDIAKVIKHIAQAFVLGMFAYLIFVRSQRFYQLPVFIPCQVGRQTRCLATTLDMSANW